MRNAILELDGLFVRYHCGLSAGFSVGPCTGRLPAGIYHLAGANGSGKTTLFKAMCGEMRPGRGHCRVDGQDVWRRPVARRHIGYLAAEPELPDFLRVDECWQFHASMRRRPDWIGAPLREALGLNGAMLLSQASSGQRRAAELLAAIAGDPVVLLLDEPFTKLDVDAKSILVDWLEGWRNDRAVILTSHADVPIAPDAAWTLSVGKPLNLDVG